jgi:hypothetical protein
MEISVGENLSDKRKEILSKAMGMHYPAMATSNGTTAGWILYDSTMQIKLNVSLFKYSKYYLAQTFGEWVGFSPYSADLTPI